jgi:UDP-glucuronate 4-epimerase
MNYIITGSKGLIGEKLKQELEKAGHRCVLEIDRRLGSDTLFLDCIYLNPEIQHVDIFFHLSAFCKINMTIQEPSLAHWNNCEGVFKSLEFCRKNGIKKFVYMSSSRILFPEENPYTASKKYGEALCEAYKQCYGIDYLIIRPSTVYGEHHDLTGRLITKWVINALKGNSLIIYGDKNKALDFTHVDDFVDGIMLLLKNWDKAKNKAYDICGNDYRKLIDVAKEIIKQTKSKSNILFGPPEITQPQDVKIDISAIKKYGYKPKIKIEEGIKRLVNFYLTEGKRWIIN